MSRNPLKASRHGREIIIKTLGGRYFELPVFFTGPLSRQQKITHDSSIQHDTADVRDISQSIA